MLSEKMVDVSNFYNSISDDYCKVEENWEAWLEENRLVLKGLIDRYCPSATRVLDCAAGIGSQAIALQSLGFDVVASDASADSLAVLSKQCDIPTVCCYWHELSDYLAKNQFDVIVCIENAISHTPDRNSLVNSLKEMRDQLVQDQDSCIFVSMRDFDKILQDKPKGYPNDGSPADRYYQEWTWITEDTYAATWYICGEKKSTTNMRCIKRKELIDISMELGMSIERCISTYYQPVFCLKWS